MSNPVATHIFPKQAVPVLPLAAMGLRDRRTDIATCLRALQNEGRILIDSAGDIFFFNSSSKTVMPMSEGNGAFVRYLGSMGITADKLFLERARNYAFAKGHVTDIHRLAWVNTTLSAIYIHSQGKAVYRVTQTDIDVINNGDDNVYFLTEESARPFSLIEKLPKDDLFDNLLLKTLRPSESVMPANQARFLLLGWFTALFVPEMLPVSPVLALVGPSSSGKTTFLNHIQLLLFGQQQPVTRQPADGKGLDALTAGRGLVCLDRVTDWGPWFEDRLESIARRETVMVKTGKGQALRRFNSSMAITARQIPDRSLDSLNLLLPVILDRPEQLMSEMVMRQQVLDARDIIMTQTLVLLQRLLLNRTRNPDGYRGGFLMPDFGDLVYRLAHTSGNESEVVKALDSVSAVQRAVLPADRNAELISLWVSINGNEGRKVKATELNQELTVLAKERGMEVPMDDRPFAYWLKQNYESIGKLFSVRLVEGRSRQLFYVISNLKKAGADKGDQP